MTTEGDDVTTEGEGEGEGEGTRSSGRVKWYNPQKGFGFIATDDGTDIFVHRSGINGFNVYLDEGQKVEFKTIQGPKGLKAIDVDVV